MSADFFLYPSKKEAILTPDILVKRIKEFDLESYSLKPNSSQIISFRVKTSNSPIFESYLQDNGKYWFYTYDYHPESFSKFLLLLKNVAKSLDYLIDDPQLGIEAQKADDFYIDEHLESGRRLLYMKQTIIPQVTEKLGLKEVNTEENSQLIQPISKPLITLSLEPEKIDTEINEVLSKILIWIRNDHYELNEKEEKYQISEKGIILFSLELKDNKINFDLYSTKVEVIENIRSYAFSANVKVFCSSLNSYLPESRSFEFIHKNNLTNEALQIFKFYDLEPIFREDDLYFALDKKNNVVDIINPNLFHYHIIWGVTGDENNKSDEFSYEVAPDIKRFVQFADRGLLPKSFYEKFKKDIKIFNRSYIDVDNPGRKLFVKPLIMDINNDEDKFYTIQNQRGSMILMTQVQPGQSLDDLLKEVLNQWNVSSGFLRALVHKNLEFDRDKKGNLTPRIVVSVYVDKKHNKIDGSNRDWDKLDKN